jgi:hypothetical protein
MDDAMTLAEQERELAAMEIRIDTQDREAAALYRQLEAQRRDAVRRLDFVEVRALDKQMEETKAQQKVLTELRAMLRQRLAELQQAKAEQAEREWVHAHGPRPASFISIADRLMALGINGHLASFAAQIVEAQQHAAVDGPDQVLKGDGPVRLGKAAARLGEIISMVGDRDRSVSVALCQARGFCQEQAEVRRVAHPWRGAGPAAGDPFAAPS